jgi:hypothetical protein
MSGGVTISSVFGSSSTDVWVVLSPGNGSGGFGAQNPYHFNGTSWVQLQLPPSVAAASFSGGWSVGSQASYIVGPTGTIVHRASDKYAVEGVPFPFAVSGAWGPNSSDVWFVGTVVRDAAVLNAPVAMNAASAIALHVGGPGGASVPPLTGAYSLDAVTGDGTTSGAVSPVWVVGSVPGSIQTAPAAWHFSGGAAGSWAGPYTVPVPSLDLATLTFHGVCCDGLQMWAVGDGPIIYSNATPATPGTPWVASTLPPIGSCSFTLNSVAATSPEDVWAVGDGGLILHWNGSAWSTVPSGTNATFTSVFAASPTSAWAAGVDPSFSSVILLAWNGMAWAPVMAPKAPVTLNPAIWSDPNSLWLYSGTTLFEQPSRAGK